MLNYTFLSKGIICKFLIQKHQSYELQEFEYKRVNLIILIHSPRLDLVTQLSVRFVMIFLECLNDSSGFSKVTSVSHLIKI